MLPHILYDLGESQATMTDRMVIVSNFLVALTTLLLWFASLHEDHKTLRYIVKRLTARNTRTPAHRKGDEPKDEGP